jgi:hypothetical protein
MGKKKKGEKEVEMEEGYNGMIGEACSMLGGGANFVQDWKTWGRDLSEDTGVAGRILLK